MSTIDTFRRDAPSELSPAGLGSLLAAVANRLESMARKRRSRRLLLELTDAQLKDIGISRADAYREADRPFWA